MFHQTLKRIFQKRIHLNHHILIYCYDESVLQDTLHTYLNYPFFIVKTKTTSYQRYESIYMFDLKLCKHDKCNLLEILKEITLTTEHFSGSQFKTIILQNFDCANDYLQTGLKYYLDKYSSIFILITGKHSKVQKYIVSHIVTIRIPCPTKLKKENLILHNEESKNLKQFTLITGRDKDKIKTYKEIVIDNILCIYKKDISDQNRIIEIREYSYRYLITGYSQVEFMRELCKTLIKNLILPVRIKGLIIKEIAFVEHIYVKTFKKQIVIEYILLKIYYLLRQYTYCL